MTRTLRAALDESNPNKLPTAAQSLPLGRGLSLLCLFAADAVASNVLVLPEEQKAGQVLRAYARVGGSTGYKTVVAAETAAPAAGQVAITPSGDIRFAAADAVTEAEVIYAPMEGEIFEDSVEVAASAATLSQSRRALQILSVTVDVGLIPGAKAIAARGSAPAAGSAALSAAGTGLAFNAADVVAGRATVRYIAVPGVGNGPDESIASALQSQVNF